MGAVENSTFDNRGVEVVRTPYVLPRFPLTVVARGGPAQRGSLWLGREGFDLRVAMRRLGESEMGATVFLPAPGDYAFRVEVEREGRVLSLEGVQRVEEGPGEP